MGVVVSEILNAVAGEKSEDGAALGGAQPLAAAFGVVGVHLQQRDESCPLRINVVRIGVLGRKALLHSCLLAHEFPVPSLQHSWQRFPLYFVEITNPSSSIL